MLGVVIGAKATHFQMPVERSLAPERGAAAPGHRAHKVVLGVDVPGQRVPRGEAGGGARAPGAGEGVLGPVVRGQFLFGREASAAVRAQAEEEVRRCGCLVGWE